MNPEQVISEGKIIGEFIKHPGMTLLVDKINKKLDTKRQMWLNAASSEEAETIRQDARVYAALMGTLNEFLVRGAQAERTNNGN